MLQKFLVVQDFFHVQKSQEFLIFSTQYKLIINKHDSDSTLFSSTFRKLFAK